MRYLQQQRKKKKCCEADKSKESWKSRRKDRFIVHVKVYNKNPKLLLTIDNRYNTIIADANNCSIGEKEN